MYRHRYRAALSGRLMGFSNPIASAGGALVRDAIHSPDYVPGVSGWSINEDGTAEFQAVTIGGQPAPDYVVEPGGEVLDRTAIRSTDYVPGGPGWRISQGGSAEFSDIVLNGSNFADVDDLVAPPGGEELARPALRSSNYVPGVSGWRITQAGDVEFAAGTFRGTVLSVQPAIRLRLAAGKIVPTSTFVDLDFDTPDFVTEPNLLFHVHVPNPPPGAADDHVLVKRGGIYLVNLIVTWSASSLAGGRIDARIQSKPPISNAPGANNNPVLEALNYTANEAGDLQTNVVSALCRLTSDSILWARVYQDSGADRQVAPGVTSILSAHMVSV